MKEEKEIKKRNKEKKNSADKSYHLMLIAK